LVKTSGNEAQRTPNRSGAASQTQSIEHAVVKRSRKHPGRRGSARHRRSPTAARRSAGSLLPERDQD